MNKILTIVLLTVFKAVCGIEMLNRPESGGTNVFHKINEVLKETMTKTFQLLNLNRQFFVQNESRLLQSIINNMKMVSEKRYYIYIDITKISKLEEKFKAWKNNSLFKLHNILNNIIATDFTVNNHTLISVNKSCHELDSSIEIPDDSEEAFTLLANYLNERENIDWVDIVQPLQKIKEMHERHRRFKHAKTKNFKAWMPEQMDVRRVFNGIRAKIKKYPFVASVHVDNKFACTGAILSRNMIITAASCLYSAYDNPNNLGEKTHSVAVRVGSDFSNRLGEWLPSSKVFFHPNFDKISLANNLAIIKIKKHMHNKKKNRKIRRIEFQRMKGDLPSSVREILILGWGEKDLQSNDQSPQNKQLSYSRLKMRKLTDCAEVYTNKFVTDKNFCAGFSSLGTGACEHDVGGPAVVSNVLIGVVSFGPSVCGVPYMPTVFTNIGNYVKWIESVLKGKVHKWVSKPKFSNVSNNIQPPPNVLISDSSPYHQTYDQRHPSSLINDPPPHHQMYDQQPNPLSDSPSYPQMYDQQPKPLMSDSPPYQLVYDQQPKPVISDSPPYHQIHDQQPKPVISDSPPYHHIYDQQPKPVMSDSLPYHQIYDQQLNPLSDSPPHHQMYDQELNPLISDSPPHQQMYDQQLDPVMSKSPPNHQMYDQHDSVMSNSPLYRFTRDLPPNPLFNDALITSGYKFLKQGTENLPNSEFFFTPVNNINPLLAKKTINVSPITPVQYYFGDYGSQEINNSDKLPRMVTFTKKHKTTTANNVKAKSTTLATRYKLVGKKGKDPSSDIFGNHGSQESNRETKSPRVFGTPKPVFSNKGNLEQHNLTLIINNQTDVETMVKNDPIKLIKHFVKDKLNPLITQLGIVGRKKEFEDKAEEFLIENYLKELSYLKANPPKVARGISDSNFHESYENQEVQKFSGKNLLKHHNGDAAGASNEYLLLLLKHSTRGRVAATTAIK